jgi:ribosome-associated protein
MCYSKIAVRLSWYQHEGTDLSALEINEAVKKSPPKKSATSKATLKDSPSVAGSLIGSETIALSLIYPNLMDTSALGIVRFCLDEMKAEEVVEIDLAGKTSIADYMFIASGRANRHVGAIAENIASMLKQYGHDTPRLEGLSACDWVLVDAGDIIVHIFRPEVRQFYNLEKMWGADRPKEVHPH